MWFGPPEIHLKHFDADSDFRHILFGAIWSYLVIGAFLGLLSWTSSKVHNQKYWAENFKIITPSQMLPFPTLRKIENTILPPPSWDRFSPSLSPHFKNKWVGENDYSFPTHTSNVEGHWKHHFTTSLSPSHSIFDNAFASVEIPTRKYLCISKPPIVYW